MKFTRWTILLILVSIMVIGFGLTAAQAQWEVVIPQKNVGDKFRVAAFHNGNFGLAGGAGDVGKAHYSTDGGRTWAVADTSGG
ncbi:MAG: hypothetical protein JW793_05260 [Acidobacteria bacterium]|nr:hypothetical protein [Acidobacteriota bacterium]